MKPENTNRLAQVRDHAGMTQQQVAAAIGVTTTGYQNWEYGNTPIKATALRELAKLFGCTTDYLLNISDIKVAVPSATRMLPVFGSISAGTPREALTQSDVMHETPERLYLEHERAFWLTVSGNSMNRLFPDGSLVLIDPDAEVRNGDVAVVFVNGDDATLKRIYHEGDSVRLHPESYDPEYRDRVIDASDPDAPEVRVIGKAVSYTAPDGWRA